MAVSTTRTNNFGINRTIVVVSAIIALLVGAGLYVMLYNPNPSPPPGGGNTGVGACTTLTDVISNQSSSFCTAQAVSVGGFAVFRTLSIAALTNQGGGPIRIFDTDSGKSAPITETISVTLATKGAGISIINGTVSNTQVMFLNDKVITSVTTAAAFTGTPKLFPISTLSREGKVLQSDIIQNKAGNTTTLSIADVGSITALLSNGVVATQMYGCPLGSVYIPNSNAPCGSSPVPRNIANISLSYSVPSAITCGLPCFSTTSSTISSSSTTTSTSTTSSTTGGGPTITTTSITGNPITTTTTSSVSTTCPSGTTWGGFNPDGTTICRIPVQGTSTGSTVSITVNKYDAQCPTGYRILQDVQQARSGGVGTVPVKEAAFSSTNPYQFNNLSCLPSTAIDWVKQRQTYYPGIQLFGLDVVDKSSGASYIGAVGNLVCSGSTIQAQMQMLTSSIVASSTNGIVAPLTDTGISCGSYPSGMNPLPVVTSSGLYAGGQVSVTCCSIPSGNIQIQPSLTPSTTAGTTNTNGVFTFTLTGASQGVQAGYTLPSTGSQPACCQGISFNPAYNLAVDGVSLGRFEIGVPLQGSYATTVTEVTPSWNYYCSNNILQYAPASASSYCYTTGTALGLIAY